MIRSREPRLFSKRLNYPECQSSARLSDVNSVSKKTYSSHLSRYIHSRAQGRREVIDIGGGGVT